MRLLIVTQVVDENDPVLSFFCNWLKFFSTKFQNIIVICLKKGDFNLPSNIRVYSLGKELLSGEENSLITKIRYAIRFIKLIFELRNQYQSVFVHMNQEYIFLGGFFWKFLGKRIFLWRNHHAGSFLTDIAITFCDKIFCTSKFSYTAKSKKNVFMPVGIDTDLFDIVESKKRKEHSILFLGRIAPLKRLDFLLKALAILRLENIDFSLDVFGDPKKEDQNYFSGLKNYVSSNGLGDRVFFHSGIPNRIANEVYSSHEIFVNLTHSGTYDKTIFEAMACGALVLTSNSNLIGKINDELILKEDDIDDLIYKLKKALNLSKIDREQKTIFLRELVLKEHSLRELNDKLFKEITKTVL